MAFSSLASRLPALQSAAAPHAGKIALGLLGLLTSGFWGFVTGVLAGWAADSWSHFLLKLKESGKARRAVPQETLLALAVVGAAEALCLPGLWRLEKTRDIIREHFFLTPAADAALAKILLRHGAEPPVLAAQQAQIKSLLQKRPERSEAVAGCLLRLAGDTRGHAAAIHLRALHDLLLGLGITEAEFNRLAGACVAPRPDSPHALLGLAPGAGLEEVAEAWRRQMQETHPDRWQGSANAFARARAEEKAVRLNTAYAEIKNQ